LKTKFKLRQVCFVINHEFGNEKAHLSDCGTANRKTRVIVLQWEMHKTASPPVMDKPLHKRVNKTKAFLCP